MGAVASADRDTSIEESVPSFLDRWHTRESANIPGPVPERSLSELPVGISRLPLPSRRAAAYGLAAIRSGSLPLYLQMMRSLKNRASLLMP